VKPARVEVGPWRVSALSDGTMRLDGGAMWGVVPKPVWEKLTPSAADNSILLALRPFLLERDGFKVVLEPGIGGHTEEKWARLYAIERARTLESSLAELGIEPGEITHVVASHCHSDHIGGWLTRRNGALAPLFPNARHLAPAREIEAAKSADPIRKFGYRAENVTVMEAADLLRGYAGREELLPGLVAHEAGGHSDAVHVLTLNEHASDAAIFWADVVPTTHHIQPQYIMAFDLDVPRSFASRSRWLARAAAAGWLGLFYHDERHAFGRVSVAGQRYRCEPLPS
jgi:glyoxylase-like metal-dependent hydrolase (beta-lactamase superfamily II)